MRVLYAEDEKAINEAVTEILIKNKYSVDNVYDGEEALEYLETIEYDIVVLDIMMPRLDGISVLKEIRRKGLKTPVLLLTAKSELEDKIAGLDFGADDYLTKPFEAKELLARLRAISRRGNNFVSDEISISNITLRRSTFELSSKDAKESFVLGNKEYQILELLMSNPKLVFSKDMLMDRIWGYDMDTDTSVVWVYISNLRKKLKKLNSLVSIKNMRNLGYHLEIKK